VGVIYDAIRVEAKPKIDYNDLSAYVRSWPDKAIAWLCDRLPDDDFQAITRELYEYCCEPDRDGPAFEDWVKT
jgi:hypothetical protein